MQNGDTIIWAADFLLSSGFGGWKWEASCKFVFRDLCVSNALSIDKRSHSCHTSSWFRFLPSRSSCKSLPIFVVTAVVVVLIRKFEHTPKYFKKQAQWIETGFVWFIHHSDSFGGHINRTNLNYLCGIVNKQTEHEWTWMNRPESLRKVYPQTCCSKTIAWPSPFVSKYLTAASLAQRNTWANSCNCTPSFVVVLSTALLQIYVRTAHANAGCHSSPTSERTNLFLHAT